MVGRKPGAARLRRHLEAVRRVRALLRADRCAWEAALLDQVDGALQGRIRKAEREGQT